MREIDVQELTLNPMTRIGKEWMLLTAGTEDRGYNTMTCSWGHLGAIWGHHGNCPTALCYVRPQRYTKEFIDREALYTLCFFDGRKQELAYLGSHSGRDSDKVKEAGLTPVYTDGTVYFEEAKLVYICRKLYHAPLKEEGFCDPALVEYNYPQKDFHEMYIGEIVKVLQKE